MAPSGENLLLFVGACACEMLRLLWGELHFRWAHFPTKKSLSSSPSPFGRKCMLASSNRNENRTKWLLLLLLLAPLLVSTFKVKFIFFPKGLFPFFLVVCLDHHDDGHDLSFFFPIPSFPDFLPFWRCRSRRQYRFHIVQTCLRNNSIPCPSPSLMYTRALFTF